MPNLAHIRRRARRASSLLAAVATCLCVCAPAVAGDDDVRARLGGFSLAVAGPEEQATVLLRHNGEKLFSEGPFRSVSFKEAASGYPSAECRNLKVEVFTGGANCCFGYYFLTSCPNGDAAARLAPYGGDVGDLTPIPNSAERAYVAMDPAFMYYEKKDAKGAQLSLSRPESPRPNRFLVFSDGAWRPDARGEFPAAYVALAEAIRKDQDVPQTARAVTAAYYDLMAEQNPETALRTLKRDLPDEYAALADAVFMDIDNAVEAFNPVKALSF